jgi:hypothetical protein
MKKFAIAAAAAALAGCATTQPTQEVEAVRDYISAAELESVKQIRTNERWGYSTLNDHFIILTTMRKEYLVEFVARCIEVTERFDPTMYTTDMVDYRRDTRVMRSRFDTIRGCRIDSIYPVTKEQAKELKNLGDAPGDEEFLPDDDK